MTDRLGRTVFMHKCCTEDRACATRQPERAELRWRQTRHGDRGVERSLRERTLAGAAERDRAVVNEAAGLRKRKRRGARRWS